MVVPRPTKQHFRWRPDTCSARQGHDTGEATDGLARKRRRLNGGAQRSEAAVPEHHVQAHAHEEVSLVATCRAVGTALPPLLSLVSGETPRLLSSNSTSSCNIPRNAYEEIADICLFV